MDSLSRIGIFIEVARQESFAGAARELGITSSAVSKQVQNLEDELAVKLLNRTTRNVSLTEEGALFYARAARALDDLAEARDQLNELKESPRGSLRVNMPMALGSLYLKKPIAHFALQYPEVTLDVTFDDRLINLTEEGYDIVFRIGVLDDSTLIARKIIPAPARLYASPAYLAAHGIPATPHELAQHQTLAYTRNKAAHSWHYKAPDGSEGTVALQGRFKCDSASMMIEAASAGLGIIIMPCLLAQHALDSGALVTFMDDYRTWPERNLYALFPPNRYLSTRLRLFVEHMDRYCKQAFILPA